MLLTILATLTLYVIQSLLPAYHRWVIGNRIQISAALGPRDNPPELTILGARRDRAHRNRQEALIVFLPLSVLCHHYNVATCPALAGAVTFLIARIAYIPAYTLGIFGLRSAIWIVGHTGLGIMAFVLMTATGTA